MKKKRKCSKAVCVKGDVYLFGGDDSFTLIMSVEKYSYSSNTWNIVADMYDDRDSFCACAFMDNIFIIGGIKTWNSKSNLQFNTKQNDWKEVAEMKEARSSAACTVYEGNVIVAGGWDNEINKMRSVESYDALSDKWSSMPNMVKGKWGHSLVVVNNKLYVVGLGKQTCEVYNSYCKKFVAIKSPQVDHLRLNHAISIGNKIFAFQNVTSSILCYDVDKDEWSEESCEVTNNISLFSCVKLPLY